MTSEPSICQNVIFLAKKLLNVGLKLSYFGIFGQDLNKATVLWYFTSAPSNFSIHKTPFKIKILKFGDKIALIGYFGIEFQNTNVVFEISILEFVNMQSFIQKPKTLNLRPKIPYLGIFRLQFKKDYYQILNQHLQI